MPETTHDRNQAVAVLATLSAEEVDEAHGFLRLAPEPPPSWSASEDRMPNGDPASVTLWGEE